MKCLLSLVLLIGIVFLTVGFIVPNDHCFGYITVEADETGAEPIAGEEFTVKVIAHMTLQCELFIYFYHYEWFIGPPPGTEGPFNRVRNTGYMLWDVQDSFDIPDDSAGNRLKVEAQCNCLAPECGWEDEASSQEWVIQEPE